MELRPTSPIHQPVKNFQDLVLENLKDAVTFDFLVDAVTLDPCGHNYNETTVVQLISTQKSVCSLCKRVFKGSVPNYTIRELAQLAEKVSEVEETEEDEPQEEAHTHFQEGVKFFQDGNTEFATQQLLIALNISPNFSKARDYLEFILDLSSVERKESASAKNELVAILWKLIDLPQINQELYQMIRELVEGLSQQEALELTPQQERFFQWIKSLFNGNGELLPHALEDLAELCNRRKSRELASRTSHIQEAASPGLPPASAPFNPLSLRSARSAEEQKETEPPSSDLPPASDPFNPPSLRSARSPSLGSPRERKEGLSPREQREIKSSADSAAVPLNVEFIAQTMREAQSRSRGSSASQVSQLPPVSPRAAAQAPSSPPPQPSPDGSPGSQAAQRTRPLPSVPPLPDAPLVPRSPIIRPPAGAFTYLPISRQNFASQGSSPSAAAPSLAGKPLGERVTSIMSNLSRPAIQPRSLPPPPSPRNPQEVRVPSIPQAPRIRPESSMAVGHIPMSKITITLRSLSGREIRIEAAFSESFNSIARRYLILVGQPDREVKFIYNREELELERTVADYSIPDGAIIHLVLRPSEQMKLTVKSATGKEINIQASPSDTIETLARKIKEKEAIPEDQQKLTYAGKILEFGHTLSDYNIHEGATIHLSINLRGD